MTVSYLPFKLLFSSLSLVLHKKIRVGDEHALNNFYVYDV